MKNLLVDGNILEGIISQFEEDYDNLNSEFNESVNNEVKTYYKNLEECRLENSIKVKNILNI